MQKLQSQLGKSLSLQLLMTVPRGNLPSDDVIRLQGAAQFHADSKALARPAAMQQGPQLGYNRLVL
jgi:hypothetical protein